MSALEKKSSTAFPDDWGGPDAIWKHAPRGSAWDPMTIRMPGLDRVRAALRGEMPTLPVQHLTGMMPVEAGVGTMTFAMPASEWFMGPSRWFVGGIFALLADSALAGAIITGLSEGVALTTQELSLHFLRPADPESQKLVARGHIIHGGRSIGLSEVHIHDAHGRLLSYGSSRCVTLKVPIPMSGPYVPPPRPPEDPDDWVPPIRRPFQGALTPDAEIAPRDGLALLDGWTDGTLPWPPFGCLFGIRPTSHSRGAATLEMPASPWLMNAAGAIYGGALAVLANAALDWAATSILQAGASFQTLDMKINFLRPVTPDGRPLTGRGQVFHSGKRMIVANCDVVDAEGRQVVVASGTRMIMQTPWKSTGAG